MQANWIFNLYVFVSAANDDRRTSLLTHHLQYGSHGHSRGLFLHRLQDLHRLHGHQRFHVRYNTLFTSTHLSPFLNTISRVPCVYFFFPETSGRSLEEMDEIFAQVSGFKGAFDVVRVARELPRRYGRNGELLIAYEDTDEARDVAERRRSSVAAGAESHKDAYGTGTTYSEKA